MNQALREEGASLRLRARITGILYLITILAGLFAQGFVHGKLVVSGDAAATASNILAHKGLYQAGFAIFLIEMASQIATTALLYTLLKPAGPTIALVAAFLGLAGCVIKTVARLFFAAPLFILGGASYLGAFGREELQALALLSLQFENRGAEMALAFFGFYAPLNGYLVFRSTYLPRFLGVMGMLGVGWVSFLYPPLAYHLFDIMVCIGLLGAGSMIVWLIVKGVNVQRWKERAAEIRK